MSKTFATLFAVLVTLSATQAIACSGDKMKSDGKDQTTSKPNA